MVIQHNVGAMNADNQLKKTAGTLQQSTQKLSSGYRINISADDASGLSISEKMRKQIRGLTQASANSEDGISMVQVADGAMAEIQEMMDRGVELSIKAANGTLSDDDREFIQMEIDQIKDEVNAIRDRTKFNEIYVLKGESDEVPPIYHEAQTVQEGGLPKWVTDISGTALTTKKLTDTYTDEKTYVSNDATLPANTVKTVQVNHAGAYLDFAGFNSDTAKAELIGQGFHTTCCTCNDYYSIEFTDQTVNEKVINASSGIYIYRIGIGDINMNTNTNGKTPAQQLLDRIIDGTDNGYPDRHNTKLAIDSQTDTKLWIYDIRSNDPYSAQPTDVGSWNDWTFPAYGVGSSGSFGKFGEGFMREEPAYTTSAETARNQLIDLQVGTNSYEWITCALPNISTATLGLMEADVTHSAEDAIELFGNAKRYVSTERTRMGSYQNRLEHTINNLGNTVENTTFSESAIRDLDMASEMVKYANASILNRSGQSMLAQANQSGSGVLEMLS
jgi:flagellin